MALDLEWATTRRQRARGLLGRDALSGGAGLLIPRCRSVHTFGMRFAIAVVFLDHDWRAIEVAWAPPGRFLFPRLRARHVLECRPDDAPAVGTSLEPWLPETAQR